MSAIFQCSVVRIGWKFRETCRSLVSSEFLRRVGDQGRREFFVVSLRLQCTAPTLNIFALSLPGRRWTWLRAPIVARQMGSGGPA